jgi:hypothetical protein
MSGLKKIEYAVGAAGLFIQHLHRENFDRGMIATFGNGFRVEQSFTGTESYLHRALARVSQSVTNEQTRLYDSLADVIVEFWSRGMRDRPWLLIVITDGQDTCSTSFRTPAAIGHVAATRYNHEDSNFMVVIGVGEGDQIDADALATLGNVGNFPAITIGAFPLLELVFLKIALQVSTRTLGRHVEVGNMSWDQVAQIRQVSQVPFDYAFLIDRSGTMSQPG